MIGGTAVRALSTVAICTLALGFPSLPACAQSVADDQSPGYVPPRIDFHRPGAPRLDYPDIALAQRMEGKVTFSVTVTKEGYGVDCAIVSSSNPIFNASSVAYCSASRYVPGTRDGLPVDVPNFTSHISYVLR